MGEYYGVRTKDDPDGEYLQHWGVPKGFQREAHKYLARLVTPSGYRYIYNQAQLAAAKAGRAIGNAIGLNQRNRAQQATARAQRISGGNKGREQSVQRIKRARMAKATAKRAQSAYDKTLLGRAEKAFNSARKGISDATSGAQKAFNDAGRQASRQARSIQRNVTRTAQNVGKAVGDATGYNQRNRAQKANARAQRISGENTGRNQSVQTIKRSRMANATARSAQSAYDKTPLGRVEGAVNSARKAVSDAVNRPLRNAIGNTATMKRIDQAQAKLGRNTRKKDLQQERLASVRGGKRVDPVWSNRADIKNPTKSIKKRTTNPNSKLAQIRRHGVDSALNLMRTGQGLDPYNITKRGAAYIRKKRR